MDKLFDPKMIYNWTLRFHFSFIASLLALGTLDHIEHSQYSSRNVAACGLALLVGSLLMPHQELRQKNLTDVGKIRCSLSGPLLLCTMVTLLWILTDLSLPSNLERNLAYFSLMLLGVASAFRVSLLEKRKV